MERNLDTEAAIIINDLDSLMHRIEALQAHPDYSRAHTKVQDAKTAMVNGRSAIHQGGMRTRFAEMDATRIPTPQD